MYPKIQIVKNLLLVLLHHAFTMYRRSLRRLFFTRVCHSVILCLVQEGAWSRGCLLRGVLAPGRVPGGDPPDGYCYASYWNAFLLPKFFFQNYFSNISSGGSVVRIHI